MPLRKYAKKRMYRKAYKKRSRFSKKKFTKYNNNVRSSLKSIIMPKELYVKLPYTMNFTTPNFTGLAPAPSLIFVGTSIFPNTTAVTPAVGDRIVASIPEYSDFYDNYTPLGASIKITAFNVSTNAVFTRLVLVPITTALGGNIAAHVAVLDTYDYEDLSSLPGAQTRFIGLGTGSNAAASFKMFRKTKNMLSVKDLRDDETLKLDLPTGTSGGNASVAEDHSWFYYFRYINAVPAASQAQQLNIEVRMKYYYMLSGRKTFTQVTSTA